MSCQAYEAAIGDYVDGTMDAARRAEVESHLMTCASCRAVVADFTLIRTVSRSLEPHVPPPHVWQRLSAAMDAEPKPLLAGGPWWRVFAPVAAMAVLVASLAWTAAQLSTAPRSTTAGPLTSASGERLASAEPVPPTEPEWIGAEYQLAERDLTSTIEGLERIAASSRAPLDMETEDVLKATLMLLDGAIGESREALKKEPENDVAQQSLFEALRNKVVLLQDTIALINEMRKGNQEGAARIVSGLNQ